MSLLFLFFTALFLSLILIPITMIFAARFGMVDDPKKHAHPAILHKKTVPRAGGLAIFLSFLGTVLFTIGPTKQIAGILLGGAILTFGGVWDDRSDLGKGVKFAIQIAATLVVVGFGIGISFIANPLNIFGGFGLGEIIRLDTLRFVINFAGTHSIYIFADLFAFFWIIWVINMLNFSAGVDGQLGGIAFIALFIIFAVSLRFALVDPTQMMVAKLALIGAGSTLGFLVFNFYPAKIFPGDSASYFLGFLIAVLAIISGAKVGTAMLVIAVPLIDGVFTVIRRVASGKSPFLGDRGHLHHRLLEIGFSQRQVALFYWLLCAILGAIAFVLPSEGKVFAGVVIGIIVLGGLLWLNTNLQTKARA